MLLAAQHCWRCVTEATIEARPAQASPRFSTVPGVALEPGRTRAKVAIRPFGRHCTGPEEWRTMRSARLSRLSAEGFMPSPSECVARCGEENLSRRDALSQALCQPVSRAGLRQQVSIRGEYGTLPLSEIIASGLLFRVIHGLLVEGNLLPDGALLGLIRGGSCIAGLSTSSSMIPSRRRPLRGGVRPAAGGLERCAMLGCLDRARTL